MNWLIENWYVLVGLICFGIGIVFICVSFFQMPTKQQIETVKEWLKYAVVQAEKELGGGGTGQLKLHLVYDLAITQFDWLEKLVSFDDFSKWVDEALVWMEHQLSTNANAKKYIKGETDDGKQ